MQLISISLSHELKNPLNGIKGTTTEHEYLFEQIKCLEIAPKLQQGVQ